MITGAGRAFSAGGDFNYLDELRNDEALRQKTIKHGRDLVIGMVRCRIPVIAAVNGPAVGLGCSLAALSDIVYIAETAFFADPHVQIGLVAADGGPLVWPSQISLLQAKEFALTGVRIKAQRAVELGLANHVVADPLAEAIACAKKLIELPQQAVEATKRLMNIQLEKSVMASLDYANLAEYVSFGTADFNKIVDGLIARRTDHSSVLATSGRRLTPRPGDALSSPRARAFSTQLTTVRGVDEVLLGQTRGIARPGPGTRERSWSGIRR